MRPKGAPEWPFVGEIHRIDDTYWRFLKTTGWTEFVPTNLERAQHAITEAAEEAAAHDRICDLISQGLTSRTRHDYTNTVVRVYQGYHVRLEVRGPVNIIGCDHVIADAHLEAALVNTTTFNAYMDAWIRSMLGEIARESQKDEYLTPAHMSMQMRAINDMATLTGVAAKDAAAKFAEFSRLLLRDPSQGKL